MVLGKLDSDMQKNEPGPLSYTIHKNKLKMSERPKCKTENHKTVVLKYVCVHVCVCVCVCVCVSETLQTLGVGSH